MILGHQNLLAFIPFAVKANKGPDQKFDNFTKNRVTFAKLLHKSPN